MKLLLIEDDLVLSSNVLKKLTKEGFAVDLSSTIEQSLVSAEVNEYDCLILDIGLPDGSGFELLHTLRQAKNKTPIIIVTARGQIEDRIKGLDMGADDYLPKPVDTAELIARIRAVIRRRSGKALSVIVVGELTLKSSRHEAIVKNNLLVLTGKEFSVLEYLTMHHGELVTRSMLMEHIWGSDFDSFSNVVDVYIKNIRRQISLYTSKSLITTIRGKGYILAEK